MKMKIRTARRWAAPVLLGLMLAASANAQDGPTAEDITNLQVMGDTLWVMIAAFLVFFMNVGFGCVEAGLCRAKNATNILGKNFVVFALSTLAFYFIGFDFMFGDGTGFIGMSGLMLGGADNSPLMDGSGYEGVYTAIAWAGVPLLAKFFFQLVFAGTAATIVSGCVAERIHYGAFMLFTPIIVGILYPITGHWIWGGGWLGDWGFTDFAGSTVVHSVGGWAGLAGIIMLGARKGKYKPDGSVQPIPGHSMALVFLGGLILWLGWFGFNPGSTMAAAAGDIAHVAVTTNLACVAAIVTSTFLAWIMLGKPDFTMTVNGALAGLVAITAPCYNVTPNGSILIGAIAGLIVVPSVIFFDRIKIDDPVGALSVHLVNGVWGTLSVALFSSAAAPGGADGLFYGGGTELLVGQVVGIVAVGAFTFVASLLAWGLIKATLGIRVSEEDEVKGLDVSEMGMEAYAGDILGK